MNTTFNVFVYGTLRSHESNHHFLTEATCLARQCWTKGRLHDTGYGYPAMVSHENSRVYGELYEVTREQLKQLDLLDNYTDIKETNLYERVIQTIYTDNGTVEAYVYLFSPSQVVDLTEIMFGDWKCHQYLKQDEHHYFAYGSCMDTKRFQQADVGHLFTKVKGCGIARNYTVAYTRHFTDGGRADMIESNHKSVEGKVYEITKEALDYLFIREGVHSNIYRPAFIEIMIDDMLYTNVLTFLVIDKREELAPPEHYATEILRGSKDFVSETYYKKLQADLRQKFNMKL